MKLLHILLTPDPLSLKTISTFGEIYQNTKSPYVSCDTQNQHKVTEVRFSTTVVSGDEGVNDIGKQMNDMNGGNKSKREREIESYKGYIKRIEIEKEEKERESKLKRGEVLLPRVLKSKQSREKRIGREGSGDISPVI